MLHFSLRVSVACLIMCSTIKAGLTAESLVAEYDISYDDAKTLLRHVEERKNRQENGKGWSKYYHILPTIINQRGYTKGCEIGVAFGGHALEIAKKTNAHLYAIDPYLDYGDTSNTFLFRSFSKQQYWDVLYLYVKERFAHFDQRLSFLRMTSAEAAIQFETDSLDFVFLDANHSYAYVFDDLHLWYDKVRSGGVLCGDDYNSQRHPGVKKAVDFFFKEKSLPVRVHKQARRFWWVEKP